jgi:hypothetical protein
MKKCLMPILLLLIIFYNIHAQENNKFEYNLLFGTLGGGMNYFSDDYNFELSASLLNNFIEYKRLNIGIELSPLNYKSFYSVNKQEWNQDIYFLNGNIYWNPFNFENIILGPFVSINYLNLQNWTAFMPNNYSINSGLKFLLRTNIKKWGIPFQIIGSELGYRNISGEHSFYFNVNVDILVLAGVVAMMFYYSASNVREANEEYERQINGTGPFVPKEPKDPMPDFFK